MNIAMSFHHRDEAEYRNTQSGFDRAKTLAPSLVRKTSTANNFAYGQDLTLGSRNALVVFRKDHDLLQLAFG